MQETTHFSIILTLFLMLPAGQMKEQCRLDEMKNDIIFLLDSSGSVGNRNFRMAKYFIYRFIERLNIGLNETHVALIRFSSSPKSFARLNSFYSKEDLLDAVRKIPYNRGSTNTAEALEYCRKNLMKINRGDRKDVKNIIIIITDGSSTSRPSKMTNEISSMKEKGVVITAVGVGSMVNKTELDTMASEERLSFLVEDYKSLFDIQTSLFGISCDTEEDQQLTGVTSVQTKEEDIPHQPSLTGTTARKVKPTTQTDSKQDLKRTAAATIALYSSSKSPPLTISTLIPEDSDSKTKGQQYKTTMTAVTEQNENSNASKETEPSSEESVKLTEVSTEVSAVTSGTSNVTSKTITVSTETPVVPSRTLIKSTKISEGTAKSTVDVSTNSSTFASTPMATIKKSSVTAIKPVVTSIKFSFTGKTSVVGNAKLSKTTKRSMVNTVHPVLTSETPAVISEKSPIRNKTPVMSTIKSSHKSETSVLAGISTAKTKLLTANTKTLTVTSFKNVTEPLTQIENFDHTLSLDEHFVNTDTNKGLTSLRAKQSKTENSNDDNENLEKLFKLILWSTIGFFAFACAFSLMLFAARKRIFKLKRRKQVLETV